VDTSASRDGRKAFGGSEDTANSNNSSLWPHWEQFIMQGFSKQECATGVTVELEKDLSHHPKLAFPVEGQEPPYFLTYKLLFVID
jgi:hypothetical protein